jgi:hypothetical protein
MEADFAAASRILTGHAEQSKTSSQPAGTQPTGDGP